MAGLCGVLRYDEQRVNLLTAYYQSKSEAEFLENIERLGISRNSQVFMTIADYLQCPAKYPQAHYLARYKSCSLLNDRSVLDLLWPFLTETQMKLFSKVLSDFRLEHSVKRYDAAKKRWRAGRYIGEPTDNESVIPRFYAYFLALAQGRNKQVCAKFEGFPVDVVFVMIGRAYAVELSA
ncbi:MAG: hypothetical protein J5486_00320 [Bacteroidaceae bacterium]|nr:hypothetical protein [Bacteroidaceae bacterium]